ncbi:hypothetical protein [Arcobacter sp. 15-2]|uniref:hypothetical protein n=1 Tax=Arcobacter sp. 15-2 TaxID=3374109 RepID=UPI00399C64AA
MTYDKKFQIDSVIIDLLKTKRIEFRTILKNTIQFIFVLNNEFKENTEKLLIDIIKEYRDYTMISLSNKYKVKSSFFTNEQDKAFNSISSKNRKYIINELISIAINNSSYINVVEKKTNIEKDNIINDFTLKYFRSFIKEKSIYQEMIIVIMKSLLFKMNRIIEKSLLVESYYKELLILIMEQYNLKNEAHEILKNPHLSKFIYEELGKIFFIMNIEYNMSLKNECENFRKWKSKYEPILEKQYHNNLNEFIKNELNLSTKNIENSLEELYFFIDGMHPTQKEKALVQETWFMFMQNLYISGC